MKKSWYIYNKKADFADLSKKLGVSPVLVRVMRNRELKTEEEMRSFLFGTLSDLYSPALLPDASVSAELIAEKIRQGKKIRIAGDYDIDGVCATYILYDALQKLGADISYVIPERIRDGYGLNRRIVEEAIEDGVDTIITCDNGIAALEEMKLAKDAGMTVVLTDHHDVRRDEQGKDILPVADTVVNAKRADSVYPEREICGAVTAWKLVRLVQERFSEPEEEWLKYLEFAALATVGDVMKLTGENRRIVAEGLRAMSRQILNPGLRALVSECGLEGKQLNTYHVGFVIGPCINAGGRLKTAEKAMQLFLARSQEEALPLAEELKQLNEDRKGKTQKGVLDAERLVEGSLGNDKVLVIYQEGLHESLAGIVAGRIKELYGKPCYVLTDAGYGGTETTSEKAAEIKGSGRSIEAYDMFRKLAECDDLLLKYGGHPMAAGLSLQKDDLEALRRRLNENCGLQEEDLVQKLWIDLVVPLAYISPELVEELEMLEPFGTGNSKPVFACRNVQLVNRRVLGKDRNMLKMDAIDETGARLTATMFGKADELDRMLSEKSLWSITYYPQFNDFRGERSLQIRLEDVQ